MEATERRMNTHPQRMQERLNRAIEEDTSRLKVAPIEYKALEFADPLVFARTLYPNIDLYPWQQETLLQLDNTDASAAEPLYYSLVAANGSGKDMIVIAVFVAYMLVKYPRTKIVATSASFNQLNSQSWPYIREAAKLINKLVGAQIMEYVQTPTPTVHCKESGSEAVLFVTDTPKRAEGHHPYPDVRNGKLIIIVNEAKSVPDEIMQALDRCTGFTHYIKVSSPAGRSGRFYRDCAREDAVHYPNNLILGREYFRRITAYDCPHIPESHIKRKADELGESSPWFKSSVLAEFTDVDANVIIAEERVLNSYKTPKPKIVPEDGPRWLIGLDIAMGGDETVLATFRGNYQQDMYCFREHRSEMIIEKLITRLESHGIVRDDKETYQLNADDGGVGKAIIDRLVEKGWRINRIHNQSAPDSGATFGNLGFQSYYNFSRILDNIKLLDDYKLKTQLSSRYFEERNRGKLYLEEKKKARTRCGASPDRADAVVLAFRFRWRQFLKKVGTKPAAQDSSLLSPHEVELELRRMGLDGKHKEMNKKAKPIRTYAAFFPNRESSYTKATKGLKWR